LGKGFVDSSTLEQESDLLQSWAGDLATDADIFVPSKQASWHKQNARL
jgi:hypothetical protein